MSDLRKLMNEIQNIFEASKKDRNTEFDINKHTVSSEQFENLPYKNKLSKFKPGKNSNQRLAKILKSNPNVDIYTAQINVDAMSKEQVQDYKNMGFEISHSSFDDKDYAYITIVAPKGLDAKKRTRVTKSDIAQLSKKRAPKDQGRKQQFKWIDEFANSAAGKYVISKDIFDALPFRDRVKPYKASKSVDPTNPSTIASFMSKHKGVIVYTATINVTGLKPEVIQQYEDWGFKSSSKENKQYMKITIAVPETGDEIDTRSEVIDPKQYKLDKEEVSKKYSDLSKDGFELKGKNWIKNIKLSNKSPEEIKELQDQGWSINVKKVPSSASYIIKVIEPGTIEKRKQELLSQGFKESPNNKGEYQKYVKITSPQEMLNLRRAGFEIHGYSEEPGSDNSGAYAKKFISINDMQETSIDDIEKLKEKGFKKLANGSFLKTVTPDDEEWDPDLYRKSKDWAVTHSDVPDTATLKINAEDNSDYSNARDQFYYNRGYKREGNKLVKTEDISDKSQYELDRMEHNGWDIDYDNNTATHTIAINSDQKGLSRAAINHGSFGKLNQGDEGYDYNQLDSMGKSSAGSVLPYDDDPEKLSKMWATKDTGQVMNTKMNHWSAQFGPDMYNKETIEDLVKIIRDHRTNIDHAHAAFNELYKRTIGAARSLSKFETATPYYADLLQEFGKTLYTAVWNYDPSSVSSRTDSEGNERGKASFTTYLMSLAKSEKKTFRNRDSSVSSSHMVKAAAITFRKLENKAKELSDSDPSLATVQGRALWVAKKMNDNENRSYQIPVFTKKDENGNDIEQVDMKKYREYELKVATILNTASIDAQDNEDEEGNSFNAFDGEESLQTAEDSSSALELKNTKKQIQKAIQYSKREIKGLTPFSSDELKYLTFAFGLNGNKPLYGKSLVIACNIDPNNTAALPRLKAKTLSKLTNCFITLGLIQEEKRDDIINYLSKVQANYANTESKKASNIKGSDHNSSRENISNSNQFDISKDHDGENVESDKLDKITSNPDAQEWIQHNREVDSARASKFRKSKDEIPQDIKERMLATANDIKSIQGKKNIKELDKHTLNTLYLKYKELKGLSDAAGVKNNLSSKLSEIIELMRADSNSDILNANVDELDINGLKEYITSLDNEIASIINDRDWYNIPSHDLLRIADLKSESADRKYQAGLLTYDEYHTELGIANSLRSVGAKKRSLKQ